MKFIELTLVPEGMKRMYRVDCIESLVVESPEVVRLYLTNGFKNRVEMFAISQLGFIKSAAINEDEFDGYFNPAHVVTYDDEMIGLTVGGMSITPEALAEFKEYLKGAL